MLEPRKTTYLGSNLNPTGLLEAASAFNYQSGFQFLDHPDVHLKKQKKELLESSLLKSTLLPCLLFLLLLPNTVQVYNYKPSKLDYTISNPSNLMRPGFHASEEEYRRERASPQDSEQARQAPQNRALLLPLPLSQSFRWMQKQWWYIADNGVYSKLISVMGKKGQTRMAMWLFSEMRNSGVQMLLSRLTFRAQLDFSRMLSERSTI